MAVRDQLLEAAARLYAETGYRGTTTRRIALQAGVNEITLFRHFGSKEALMREAIARARRTRFYRMCRANHCAKYASGPKLTSPSCASEDP
jgi:AcrR family transcriptional regulator